MLSMTLLEISCSSHRIILAQRPERPKIASYLIEKITDGSIEKRDLNISPVNTLDLLEYIEILEAVGMFKD